MIYEKVSFAMVKVNIIIPADDYDIVAEYYRRIFDFCPEDELFYFHDCDRSLAIKIIELGVEARRECPPKKGFPIFEYELKKNFLSHCLMLKNRGAVFEKIFEHPGGFYARVLDPSGNQFGIVCESFEEEEQSVGPEEFPNLFRY